MGGAVVVERGGFADQVEAERVEHPGEALPRAVDAAALALAVGVDGAAELAGRPVGPDADIAIAADPALLVEVEEQEAGALFALLLVVGDEGAHRVDGERLGQGVDRRVDLRVAEKFMEAGGIVDIGEARRGVFCGDHGGCGHGSADGCGFLVRDRGAGKRDAWRFCHASGIVCFAGGCHGRDPFGLSFDGQASPGGRYRGVHRGYYLVSP